jgi:hypothetical protein
VGSGLAAAVRPPVQLRVPAGTRQVDGP